MILTYYFWEVHLFLIPVKNRDMEREQGGLMCFLKWIYFAEAVGEPFMYHQSENEDLVF